MIQDDHIYRFRFEDLGIRGEIVRLKASAKAVFDNQTYPDHIASQLGQGLAAATLLAGTIKLDGSLILQIQSEGPLHTLVAQATDEGTIRGLARWRGEVPAGNLSNVYGKGRLVITIDAQGSERYQGIVELTGDSLAAAIDEYFHRSEQLRTKIWLMSDSGYAAGLMLQHLPSGMASVDDWNRLELISQTLRPEELYHLPIEDLLYRLFNEDKIRLYKPKPISFHCNCSRERIKTTLRALGRGDIDALLKEEGQISVDCEFCSQNYRFDSVDVGALFESPMLEVSPTIQ